MGGDGTKVSCRESYAATYRHSLHRGDSYAGLANTSLDTNMFRIGIEHAAVFVHMIDPTCGSFDTGKPQRHMRTAHRHGEQHRKTGPGAVGPPAGCNWLRTSSVGSAAASGAGCTGNHPDSRYAVLPAPLDAAEPSDKDRGRLGRRPARLAPDVLGRGWASGRPRLARDLRSRLRRSKRCAGTDHRPDSSSAVPPGPLDAAEPIDKVRGLLGRRPAPVGSGPPQLFPQ